MTDFKISSSDFDTEFKYGNLYTHVVHESWSSVIAAPNDMQIPFILDVARKWEGPFVILYVLVFSRCGHKAARYQSKDIFSYDKLEPFMYKYQKYFERDSRHHVWVIDSLSNDRIVYDNHDVIYIYGDNHVSIETCKVHGLENGSIRIPSPHSHCYNPQHDKEEETIINGYEWFEFPLVEEHDDP